MKLKLDWRKHIKSLYLIAAITVFGIGCFIAYLGNSADNPLLIFVGFVGLASGFMLFLAWRKQGDIRLIRGKADKEGGQSIPPNSLIHSRDWLVFEYVENPTGQSMKYHNDGKYYYVHEKGASGDLKEFTLPDDDDKERHYDPGEMSNVVTMPSNKKYFTWAAGTMQKISIGVMGLIIAGEIIGLIAIEG